MEQRITLNSIFAPSEDVVARVIEDELLLVPIATGIGDIEDELYTLNDTGREIWNRLDGQATLGEIAAELVDEYQAPLGEIERDVLGLANELSKRRMLMRIA